MCSVFHLHNIAALVLDAYRGFCDPSLIPGGLRYSFLPTSVQCLQYSFLSRYTGLCQLPVNPYTVRLKVLNFVRKRISQRYLFVNLSSNGKSILIPVIPPVAARTSFMVWREILVLASIYLWLYPSLSSGFPAVYHRVNFRFQ